MVGGPGSLNLLNPLLLRHWMVADLAELEMVLAY